MEADPGERLHRLVDTLPTGEIEAAERYVEYLCEHGDPFVEALMNAPEMAEPLSNEERERRLTRADEPSKPAIWFQTRSSVPNSGYEMDVGSDPTGARGHEEARAGAGAAGAGGHDRLGRVGSW